MLNELLAALRRSRETSETKAAYQEFLRRLDAGQVAKDALGAGDPMPTFLLPNAEGQLVSSTDLLSRGPLVVTFFRGDWCPYCAATLDALETSLPDLSAAGATLVAMTPDTGGRALAMKHRHNLGYEVLVDVDLAVAMLFGIVFKTPPLYAKLLRNRGIDLAERSGNLGWLLPIPAAFVVARTGIIERSWIDIDFIHRAEPVEIVTAVKTLAAGAA